MLWIDSSEKIAKYFVYEYFHIDWLRAIWSPYDYFKGHEKAEIDRATSAVEERLLRGGWEGDGEIGIIWLPPFVDIGIEEPLGFEVWHVKQENNGMSFLASSRELPYKCIKQYNHYAR